jgi:hypothetical protein
VKRTECRYLAGPPMKTPTAAARNTNCRAVRRSQALHFPASDRETLSSCMNVCGENRDQQKRKSDCRRACSTGIMSFGVACA